MSSKAQSFLRLHCSAHSCGTQGSSVSLARDSLKSEREVNTCQSTCKMVGQTIFGKGNHMSRR